MPRGLFFVALKAGKASLYLKRPVSRYASTTARLWVAGTPSNSGNHLSLAECIEKPQRFDKERAT
jgi:hypothetical protein